MDYKLKVIIDARMLNEHFHGIGRYTYELVKYMASEGDVKLLLLVNNLKLSTKLFHGLNNIEFVKMKSKFLSIGEQIELPLVLNRYKDEYIFHSPSFVSSPLIKCKMVMTIHDLNHLKFPQYYTPFHKYYYKYIVKKSAQKCNSILTVSNFSKNEIVNWLGCEASKVIVTYNGVNSEFKKIIDKNKINRIKEKYKLPDEFILYIGNLKPHKNVERLIEAMSLVKESKKLVINGCLNKSIKDIINRLNLQHRVQFIGYVDEKDLPVLYNIAQIFVYPSLYEGFGLPPLEAMACGCIALVSNVTSLPEVVHNESFMFDPMDIGDISEKINAYIDIIDNEAKNKVIIESNKFNWASCFKRTKEIYYSI